jgi:hypothetical protein
MHNGNGVGPEERVETESKSALNDPGELDRIADQLESGRAQQLFEAARMAGPGIVGASGYVEGLNSRDAAVTFVVQCTTPEMARQVRFVLEGFLAQDPEHKVFAEAHLEPDGGSMVTVRTRVTDLPGRAVRLLGCMMEQG